jgi:hypothetical protein
MIPAGEDTQEAQQQPQNDNHDNDYEEEENNEEEEEEANKGEGKDDEDYTPLSDTEKDKMVCDTAEIKTVRNEAPIPTSRLRDLLNHLNITTHPNSKSKGFCAMDGKSTRQLWRSSADLMCSAVIRVQLSEPRTRMQ